LTRLLQTINDPSDLRRLSMEQLSELAAEIREDIIKSTSVNGGHLAPNLGVVELTLALHYAFDTPNDKLIWDVGHQCYAHKLITGRRDDFLSLRQLDGISGFCSRKESKWDHFTTGHCSNSISLALGMAKARDLKGEDHKVIAIIGDGALDGGMSFEALNHAGDIASPLLVVLNDNKMSINRNVGALHRHLDKLRANPKYGKAKRNVQSFLEHIPLIGKPMAKGVSHFKNKIKSLLVSGMYFEDLGFTYLGPVDGHDIPGLINIFTSAAAINKPVIIHTMTEKGKGYAPAQESPRLWHGVDPFDIESGKPKQEKKSRSYTQVFGDTVISLAEKDHRIAAITAAMTDGTGLAEFKNRFPDRFFDVGIAEQHATSFAAGLANNGMRPFLAIYSSFLQRAYDQIIEDVCLQELPVVIAVDRAGIVGQDGCTHQGMFDITYLRSIPNLTVMAPASADELEQMLRFAAEQNSPCAVRYPRGSCDYKEIPLFPMEKGHSAMLNDGSDLAIFALGAMVSTACRIKEILQQRGINARVINARFAAPIDKDALYKAAEECDGRIVTIEDNVMEGGFGEGCMHILAEIKADLFIFGLPKEFIPHGSRDQLLLRLGLDADSIAQSIINKWFR